MRTQTDIKQYFKETFTDFEGIKTVIVGTYDEVTEATLNDIEYPALWITYPFTRKKVIIADYPCWKWHIEALMLKHAKVDETDIIEQNYDDCQLLGEAFIQKMNDDAYNSNGAWQYEEADEEEWQPKEQYGLDNCNGWLIPFYIITT